jgi:AraC family ethanolamine operon transcriptional activator
MNVSQNDIGGFALTSNASIRSATFRDIDEQAAQLLGHSQVYQQISRGPFRGKYTTAGLGNNCWLFIEELNQTLLVDGSVPSRSVSFFFLLDEGGHCRFQGDDFTGSDLAVLPPSSSFSMLCSASANNCVISLDAHEVSEHLATGPSSSMSSHRMRSEKIGNLVSRLRHIVRNAPIAVAKAQSSADELRQLLSSTLTIHHQPEQLDLTRCSKAVFQRACSIINSELSNISVASLCRTLSVSRRALELAFTRELSIGPSSYIRTMRLNHIRRSIIAGIGKDSIADIAARWGIWHPSRFARAYAEMFGELPSATKDALISFDRASVRRAPRFGPSLAAKGQSDPSLDRDTDTGRPLV